MQARRCALRLPSRKTQGGRAQRERTRASDSPGGAVSSSGRATATARRLRTRATVSDPRGVEHPQRAIGSKVALLARVQRLACWRTSRPVGLEATVLPEKRPAFQEVAGGPYPGAGA